MEIQIVGDEDGIKLWQLMSQSSDPQEKKYFEQLNQAATKHGSVWFSDTYNQNRTGRNQAIFFMEWKNNQWVVSLFYLPDGATKEIRDRNVSTKLDVNDIWEEVSADDIIAL